jgi:hypothetical protein
MSKPEDKRPKTDEEVKEELRTRQPLYEELAEQPPIESPPPEPKTIQVKESQREEDPELPRTIKEVERQREEEPGK